MYDWRWWTLGGPMSGETVVPCLWRKAPQVVPSLWRATRTTRPLSWSFREQAGQRGWRYYVRIAEVAYRQIALGIATND